MTTGARRIRVLVVDDSAPIRRLLRALFETDPEIEVAGVAADGRAALSQIDELDPDLVTLDIEMPVLDGISCLRELRKKRPNLPVLMLSTLTERGAAATLDALALGASDYVTKPQRIADRDQALDGFRAQIIPKIKALGGRRLGSPGGPAAAAGGGAARTPALAALAAGPAVTPARAPATFTLAAPSTVVPEIVAIGVSTGGPNALAELLPALPASFPVPIVIAQHIPPVFSTLLAGRLAGASRIRVREAKEGDALEAGTALIAPGNFHMVVAGRLANHRVTLNQNAPENSCRPAVDVLLRSVVEVYGPRCLALIMTGMGQDGFAGCKAVRAAGGRVLAQDEASSVVWGMPSFIAKAGLAEEVLPLDRLAAALVSRVTRAGRAREKAVG